MGIGQGDQPREPDVIELGPEEPEELDELDELPGPAGLDGLPVRRRWRGPPLSYPLAGLGALALFASLVGDWATTTVGVRFGDDDIRGTEVYVTGVETIGGWGTGWMIGGLALVAALGVGLFGPVPARATARTAGLALAGGLAGLVVAASIVMTQHGGSWVFRFRMQAAALGELDGVDVVLGPGLYAGYAALGLVALALWLARPPGPAGGTPVGHAPAAGPAEVPVPGDVTVAAVAPLAYPDQRYEWR